jgi:hypothetical protein
MLKPRPASKPRAIQLLLKLLINSYKAAWFAEGTSFLIFRKFIHSLDFLALRAVLFDQAKRTKSGEMQWSRK